MSRDAQFTQVNEDAKRDELEHWARFAGAARGRRRPTLNAIDRRRLVTLAAGAAVLLIVLVFIWRPWSGLDAAARALGGDSAAVLIQVRDEDGKAIANAIVMHDRTDPRGSVVGVPDDLAVDVPVLGVGSSSDPSGAVTLAEALVVAGESLSRDALGDVLGVSIDSSWVLEARTFGTLVDRLGGIEIDSARVDGDIALARATSVSQPAAERADRFAEVLVGLFGKIPHDFGDAQDLLDAIGLVGDDQLAAILSGAAADLSEEALTTGVLPVQGSGLLDVNAATPIVRDLLGPQLQSRSADATPRIIVQVAITGTSGEVARIKEAARVAILNAGYRFIDGGSVGTQGSSSITTYGNSGIGDALARTLGLDQAVVSPASEDGLADAIVVLGEDYQR